MNLPKILDFSKGNKLYFNIYFTLDGKAKPLWHHFGGKIDWFRPQKKEFKGEFMIWRTKM
jgi:hypothetical protein